MALTIPSPTRAMIVSSVAPPITWFKFARTVTLARTRSSIPLRATAARACGLLRGGQSMTLGYTLVCTASSTSRPARSIAVACLKFRSNLALWAAMMALVTSGTLPPAR